MSNKVIIDHFPERLVFDMPLLGGGGAATVGVRGGGGGAGRLLPKTGFAGS